MKLPFSPFAFLKYPRYSRLQRPIDNKVLIGRIRLLYFPLKQGFREPGEPEPWIYLDIEGPRIRYSEIKAPFWYIWGVRSYESYFEQRIDNEGMKPELTGDIREVCQTRAILETGSINHYFMCG